MKKEKLLFFPIIFLFAITLIADDSFVLEDYLTMKKTLDPRSINQILNYYFKPMNEFKDEEIDEEEIYDNKRYIETMLMIYYIQHPNAFIKRSKSDSKFFDNFGGYFNHYCNLSALTDCFYAQTMKKYRYNIPKNMPISVINKRYSMLNRFSHLDWAGCKATYDVLNNLLSQYPNTNISNLTDKQKLLKRIYDKYIETINNNVTFLAELNKITKADLQKCKVVMFSYCKERIETNGLIAGSTYMKSQEENSNLFKSFMNYDKDAVKFFLTDFMDKLNRSKDAKKYHNAEKLKDLLTAIGKKGAHYDFLSEHFIKNLVTFSSCYDEKFSKETGLDWESKKYDKKCGVMSYQAVILGPDNKIKYIFSFNNSNWPKLISYKSLDYEEYFIRTMFFYCDFLNSPAEIVIEICLKEIRRYV